MRSETRRGKRLTHVTAECGHQFRTAYPAERLRGASTDCIHCGALLLFPLDIAGTAVRADLFHKALHASWSEWPEDGAGTYSLAFGRGLEPDA